MREVFTLICGTLMIAASFTCIAQEDMVSFTLDAQLPITLCKIVALKDTEDVGQVESIVGSKLNLRIHRDNVYKVTIRNEVSLNNPELCSFSIKKMPRTNVLSTSLHT